LIPGKSNIFERKLKISRLLDSEDNTFNQIKLDAYASMSVNDIDNLTVNEESVIKNTIQQKVLNTLMLYFRDNIVEKNIIIDNTFSGIYTKVNLHQYQRSAFSFLFEFDNKVIVSNGNVMSIFQDFSEYSFKPQKNKNRNISLSDYCYSFGTLNNNDLYVDLFLRWDDNRIIIFDKKPYYDVSNYKLSLDYNFNLQSEIKISFNLYLDESILDNMVIYNIKDSNMIIL